MPVAARLSAGYNRVRRLMEFRILGPLEVESGGRTVELGGTRQRALLAILLLHRGSVVSADRLIDDLYGAQPPATAAKSLQAHVSRLRKALEPDRPLRTRAGGYVLDLADAEVDAERFALLVADGGEALAANDAAGAAQPFQEALELWRGPPLVDFSYEGFAQNEMARLDELVSPRWSSSAMPVWHSAIIRS